MQHTPKMIVTMKNGDRLIFSVPDEEHFHRVVGVLSSLFTRWMYIGRYCAVKKSAIECVSYLDEGKIDVAVAYSSDN